MTVHSLEHQSYEGPGKIGGAELAAACAAELVPARYVQTHGQLVARQPDLAPAEAALFGLLDALAV